MAHDEKYGLAEHLYDLMGGNEINRSVHQSTNILANPQAHIDALVEAGVLDPLHKEVGPPHQCYTVVQPHKHSWHVAEAECHCGQNRDLRNLPSLIPVIFGAPE